MDILNALGLVAYVPKSANSTGHTLAVSYPLDPQSRAFCAAVAEVLGMTLVDDNGALHWGDGGDITIDPHQCIASADHKRQLWQQLYPLYDHYHRNAG